MPATTTTKTTAKTTIDDIQRLVRQQWGYDRFRPLQQEAIENVLAGRDSVVVLPTGGGKSLCFQAPACALDGLAVVVSPLISLMKDQVDALRTNGVAAAYYNSSLTPGERNDVIEAVRSDALKLLYLAPEGLLNENMLALLSGVTCSLFAIDEAHCISSWGHDFRPEYRGLQTLKQRFPNISIHAYTATATEQVRQDIALQLALDDPALLVGSFDRPNLKYRVARRAGGIDQLLEVINQHPDESGIVYCISRKEVEKTAAALKALGHTAVPYHAGLSDQDRQRNQEAFLEERVDIVVATVAFGMGIDKSNVRFVIHAGMPKSLEAYQQESGRAGRDGLEADCCLFYGGGDRMTWQRLMDSSGESNTAAIAALDAIDRFCKSTHCRHKSLVEHFGQAFALEDCQACDICLGELDLVDEPLIIAQKILSCVVRLQQNYGAEYTALVLTGSRDGRILEKGHDQLSTYSLLKAYTKGTVRDWIEQLTGQGCVARYGEYSQLQVTERGREVLRGELTPKLLKPAPKRKGRQGQKLDPGSWDGVDRDLFEQLRELRRTLATEQGVPAYIVFGDATLRDMARRRPSTAARLLEVQGVGQKKCDNYGAPFLEAIEAYCLESQVALDPAANDASDAPVGNASAGNASVGNGPAGDSSEPSGLSAAAVSAFPHFRAGCSVAETSQKLSRAESTIRGYLGQFIRHEQVTDPSPWVEPSTVLQIHAALDTVGAQRLKPLYEHLGGKVPYDQIRIVASCWANAQG